GEVDAVRLRRCKERCISIARAFPGHSLLKRRQEYFRDCVKSLREPIAIDGFHWPDKSFQIQVFTISVRNLWRAGSRRTWNRTMRIGFSGLFTQSLTEVSQEQKNVTRRSPYVPS